MFSDLCLEPDFDSVVSEKFLSSDRYLLFTTSTGSELHFIQLENNKIVSYYFKKIFCDMRI